MSFTSTDVSFYNKESSSIYTDVDEVVIECPRFANQGCFMADFTSGSNPLESFPTGLHKGCSMYPLGDSEDACSQVTDIGTSCRGKQFSQLTVVINP